MLSEPTIQPMPYNSRKWFFRGLLTMFLVMVPVFMFYASGYRVSWLEGVGNIVSVGGIFISAEAEDTAIFINDEPVENMRMFQQAAYIQNLPAGSYRLHVQGEGLHTWVKELPVYSQLVTEAQAFNFPVVPQLRYISEYQTSVGQSVLRGASVDASSTPLANDLEVVYDSPWTISTSSATTTLVRNPEYAYMERLFGTTTASTSISFIERLGGEFDRFSFSSATATKTLPVVSATSTVQQRDRRLYSQSGEVYVEWQGDEVDQPYYFCKRSRILATLPIVSEADAAVPVAETATERICVNTIKLQREGERVVFFDFYPSNPDLVVMQRSSGLYVMEVDDRGWQNKQLVYPGGDFEVMIDGNQIFIKTNGQYFELATTLDA